MTPASGAAVGFVGLGNMGLPMAANLVGAGFAVTGFDLDDAARGELGAAGGRPADRLADVARGAGVVVLMLPDSGVVEAVARDEAFAAALLPGAVVVDMSSSEPLRTRALGAELRRRDTVLVDAPVSGGVARARTGTLTIMAGGDDAALAAVEPVLAALGTVVRTGPLGSGHALKALNNLLSATHLLATAEAMVAGERFGLDPAVMLEVFNGSSGRSGSTENKWPNFVLTGTFDSGFALRLMLKDMRIAVGLADQVGAADRLSAEAVALWAQAAADLPPAADHTEVARWVRQRAGSDTDTGTASDTGTGTDAARPTDQGVPA